MRRGLTSLLAVAAIVLAGCSTHSRPRVSFYAQEDTVRVAPVRYCDLSGENCSQPRPSAVTDLVVPPGLPVQISVPKAVAKAPWQVVFRYRTAGGEQRKGRSPVFTPGSRHAYTLRLPEPGMQLQHVEVQRYAATLTVGPQGSLRFKIGGTWVLNAEPPEPASS